MSCSFLYISPLFLVLFFQIANSINSWIITGGRNTDLLQHMNGKTVCIGITTWGTVYNRKKLTKVDKTVHYHLPNWYISEIPEENGVYLGKCHTHFLLVDDGYAYRFGGEIPFRTKLEETLRNYEAEGDLNFQ